VEPEPGKGVNLDSLGDLAVFRGGSVERDVGLEPDALMGHD
jgi:hypothetical protein